MTNNIMNIGVSGLRTAQVALLTTGHNISNATTPGYNRQQAIQSSNVPVSRGDGFIGQGVQVNTVQRVYNQFLVNQSLQTQAQSSQLNSYYNEISQIDNLLADPASGLTPALHDFFNAVHDVASNPASIPSRQAMLSTAESLVSRFQLMDQRLSEMYEGVNAQIASHVTEINSLAQQVSKLNKDIQVAEGQANGQPANDLHDQRDVLVRDLSQLVHVDVIQQNGHYNIFIGNGQPLVVGGSHMALKVVESPDDRQRLTVAMDTGNAETLLPEHQLRGGNLGGLLNYRSDTLDSVQQGFDEIAFELADAFNAQHKQGFDLQGTVGGEFFEIDLDQKIGSASRIKVTITDPAEIAAAESAGGVTDNLNALKLAELQTKKVMHDKTASFQSAYAQIVSEVGNKTRELEVSSKAQENLLVQVDQSIQSISGVNLEEEAANLIRYQQLFQASSKVIEIGNSLFDSILRI